MKQSSEQYPETIIYSSERIEYYIRKAHRMRAEYMHNLFTEFGRGIISFLKHGKSAQVPHHPGSTLPV